MHSTATHLLLHCTCKLQNEEELDLHERDLQMKHYRTRLFLRSHLRIAVGRGFHRRGEDDDEGQCCRYA